MTAVSVESPNLVEASADIVPDQQIVQFPETIVAVPNDLAIRAGRYMTQNAVERKALELRSSEILAVPCKGRLSHRERRAIRRTEQYKSEQASIRADQHTVEQPEPWANVASVVAGERIANTISPVGTPVEPGLKESLTKIIGRRRFLQGMRNTGLRLGAAGLLIQYGAMADTINGLSTQIANNEAKLWPADKPHVTMIDGITHGKQKAIYVYLPGFGDVKWEDEAKTWKDESGIDEDSVVIAVNYSHEGCSLDDIADVIEASVNMDEVEIIHYVCRSIGGLYAFPVAARLGKIVGNMLLIASPSRLSNGDFGRFAHWLAKAPKRRFLSRTAKFATNMYFSMRDRGFDLPRNTAEGWHATETGESDSGLHEELITADPIRIMAPDLQPDLRQVMRPGITKVLYTATNEPMTDKTVLTVASAKEFGEECADLGVNFEVRGLDYIGHADVEATGKQTSSWTLNPLPKAKILADPKPAK